jgi:hypothetical protein
MSSIPALSPLTSSLQANAFIIFQGETFPIFKELFLGYSRPAADRDHLSHSTFIITSPVTRESVQIFIAICQGKPAPFQKSQILDLLSLCEEWRVDSLKDYLLNLIENDDDQILTSLRYAIEKGYSTDPYEARARGRFCELADKDELLELPISVLRRIVDLGLQEANFEKLFGFLIKCLDRFGSGGSVLFGGLDLRHFSVSQVEELNDRRCFLWPYLADSVCETLSVSISEMEKHRRHFEEEHRQLCDLQSDYRRVVLDSEAVQRTQNDRLASLEGSLAAFESSVERRLGLVESNSVSRSELERGYVLKSELQTDYVTESELQRNYTTTSVLQAQYATRSELQRDYATKSELQTNYTTASVLQAQYATKSELQSNYATKSELQTNYTTTSALQSNYATKSEVQSRYLTKSDATALEQRCASKAHVDEELNLLKKVAGRFPPIPSVPLKGIIHHLTLEYGGNVHDRGVVSITANRPYDDHPVNAAKNIADLEADSYFVAANVSGVLVCYDFKTMKVILAGYSIRSCYAGNWQNLKSWVIEVSNDGAQWTEADRRENRDELCAWNVVRSFDVSKPSCSRYVRLRQIGHNSSNHFQTVVSGFELFGALTF